MRRKDLAGPGREPPVLLVKWYDLTRWLLEKVDSFPKSQRFIFGTRLADHAIGVLETLVEASYSSTKAALLADANRKVETLRWLVRLAKDRKVLTERQVGGDHQAVAFVGLADEIEQQLGAGPAGWPRVVAGTALSSGRWDALRRSQATVE